MLRNRSSEQSDAVALYPKNLQEILNSITQAAEGVPLPVREFIMSILNRLQFAPKDIKFESAMKILNLLTSYSSKDTGEIAAGLALNPTHSNSPVA